MMLGQGQAILAQNQSGRISAVRKGEVEGRGAARVRSSELGTKDWLVTVAFNATRLHRLLRPVILGSPTDPVFDTPAAPDPIMATE